MRNLKRVLSLALALVMVLGMMVIGSSAATFTDEEKITEKEAVEVMAALGILIGDNGAFNPTGTLNRAGAAKLIAFMTMGAEADNYLAGSTASFDDVAANHWAAKYIAYCSNLKIIDGNGDGTFNPDGNISTVGFAKLVLGAAGVEGTYTGAGWEQNVKNAAEKADLDVITIDNTDITREEAAALMLAGMKYSATPAVYNVMKGAVKVGTFTDLLEASLYASVLGNAYTVEPAPATDSLLYSVYGVTYLDENQADDFGRPGVRYIDTLTQGEKLELFYAETPSAVYTAPVQAAAIAKAYAKYTFATGSAATISDNANYGKVVEVYSSVIAGTPTVTDIVVVEELLGKVTKVTEAKGEAKRTVTVAGMPFETESFAKGDVVLYTVAGGEIQSMVAPATFAGKIESYNATLKTVTVGGKTYNYGHDFSLNVDFLKDQVFTLYSDGSIAAQVEKTAAAAAVSTNYVYVVKTEYQAWAKGSTTLLGSSGAKAAAAKAEVIFANGTKAVIDLTITNTETDATKDPVYVVDKPNNEGAVATKQALTVAPAATATDTIGTWFAYTVAEDGTYTLTAINAKYAAVVDGLSLNKDEMKQVGTKFTTADTTITSVDTKYVVSNKTGFVKATLTGNVLYTYAQGSNTVAAIYAVGQTPASAPADTTIYYAVKAGNVVKGGTEWTFAAKGAQVTVVVKTGTVVPGGFYKLTALTGADAGLYSVADASMTGNALVTLISGNQVAFSDGTVKVLAKTYNVYNIDETAEVAGEVKALEVGDVIYYTVNSDLELNNIWVYGVDATVETDPDNFVADVYNAVSGMTIYMTAGNYAKAELRYFYHAIDGLTIEAADDVTSAGICFYGNADQAVMPVNVTIKNVNFVEGEGVNVAHVAAGVLKGLTIEGCTFTGTANIATTNEGVVEDLVVDNCVFEDIDGTGSASLAIHALNVKNVTVKSSIFNNIAGNAIQTNNGCSGKIVIADNAINTTGDRAIRMVIGANTTVSITNNTLVDACDGDDEVFKVGDGVETAVATGSKITFADNTYNGEAWDPVDITPSAATSVAYTIAQG